MATFPSPPINLTQICKSVKKKDGVPQAELQFYWLKIQCTRVFRICYFSTKDSCCGLTERVLPCVQVEDVCYKRSKYRDSALIRDKVDASVAISKSLKSVMTFHGGKKLYPLPKASDRWSLEGRGNPWTWDWKVGPIRRRVWGKGGFKARSQKNVVGNPTAWLLTTVWPVCASKLWGVEVFGRRGVTKMPAAMVDAGLGDYESVLKVSESLGSEHSSVC